MTSNADLIEVVVDAMEPSALPRDEGVDVFVLDSGLEVTLTGERATVRRFLANYWGDEGWASETAEHGTRICPECRGTFDSPLHAAHAPLVRTILVHLNVEVPASDTRTADEIGAFLDDALVVGLEGHDDTHGGPLTVTVALAEQIA